MELPKREIPLLRSHVIESETESAVGADPVQGSAFVSEIVTGIEIGTVIVIIVAEMTTMTAIGTETEIGIERDTIVTGETTVVEVTVTVVTGTDFGIVTVVTEIEEITDMNGLQDAKGAALGTETRLANLVAPQLMLVETSVNAWSVCRVKNAVP